MATAGRLLVTDPDLPPVTVPPGDLPVTDPDVLRALADRLATTTAVGQRIAAADGAASCRPDQSERLFQDF